MKTNYEDGRSRTAKLGWVILLGLSALLVFAGINWYVGLSQMTLENLFTLAAGGLYAPSFGSLLLAAVALIASTFCGP